MHRAALGCCPCQYDAGYPTQKESRALGQRDLRELNTPWLGWRGHLVDSESNTGRSISERRRNLRVTPTSRASNKLESYTRIG